MRHLILFFNRHRFIFFFCKSKYFGALKNYLATPKCRSRQKYAEEINHTALTMPTLPAFVCQLQARFKFYITFHNACSQITHSSISLLQYRVTFPCVCILFVSFFSSFDGWMLFRYKTLTGLIADRTYDYDNKSLCVCRWIRSIQSRILSSNNLGIISF